MQVCGLCLKVEVQGAVVPIVPEDVEESTPVKKFVTPSAPTAAAKSRPPAGTQCSEPGVENAASDEVECTNIVQEEGKRDTSDCH